MSSHRSRKRKIGDLLSYYAQALCWTLEKVRAGRASYAEFTGMGHALDLSPSPRAWLEAIQKHQHGEFDQEFLDRVESWLTGR